VLIVGPGERFSTPAAGPSGQPRGLARPSIRSAQFSAIFPAATPAVRLEIDLDQLADEVATRVAARLADRLPPQDTSPWMAMDEAIRYTKIPAGTFRKLVAAGRLPVHGGRRKLFHRAELDSALRGSSRLSSCLRASTPSSAPSVGRRAAGIRFAHDGQGRHSWSRTQHTRVIRAGGARSPNQNACSAVAKVTPRVVPSRASRYSQGLALHGIADAT
jgi:hypothetical protein